MKVSGLDAFQRHLREVQEAVAALDGEVASVRFDPNDPGSIEAAVSEMEAAVDSRVAKYQGNATVRELAEAFKEESRRAIYAKAAAARLDADGKTEPQEEGKKEP